MLHRGTRAAPRRFFPCLLAAAPIVLVYGILYRYATALPCLDDYNAVLNFLLQQRSAATFGDKLLNVAAFQHAEYKLFFEHALFALWYGVRGSFSFRVFVTLGDLLLLPLLWALWCATPRGYTRLSRSAAFFPAPWLLFQLTYAELVNWTMASLSGLAVVVFALGSLVLLVREDRRSFAWSLLLALLACGSSSNGFLAAPVGALALWLADRPRRIFAWLVPFAVMVPPYLYHYVRNVSAGAPSLGQQVRFFFSFLGGAIENMHGFPIPSASVVLGALLLAVFADAVRSRLWRRAPALFAMAVWVLLTAALAAHVRSSISVAQSLSGRYKIYSTLLLIFALTYLADRVRYTKPGSWLARSQRAVWAAAVAAAVVFSVAGDVVGARFLARRQTNLVEGMRRYREDPVHNSPLYAPEDEQDFPDVDRRFEQEVLTAAIQAGIYQIPALPPEPRGRDAR